MPSSSCSCLACSCLRPKRLFTHVSPRPLTGFLEMTIHCNHSCLVCLLLCVCMFVAGRRYWERRRHHLRQHEGEPVFLEPACRLDACLIERVGETPVGTAVSDCVGSAHPRSSHGLYAKSRQFSPRLKISGLYPLRNTFAAATAAVCLVWVWLFLLLC